jgi:hypothetical protein
MVIVFKPSSPIIDEIRLLLKIILVKFQPDIPILMIVGGDLTRCGPTTGGRERPPLPLKLARSTYNEHFMD